MLSQHSHTAYPPLQYRLSVTLDARHDTLDMKRTPGPKAIDFYEQVAAKNRKISSMALGSDSSVISFASESSEVRQGARVKWMI